jgi:hypothetical protein
MSGALIDSKLGVDQAIDLIESSYKGGGNRWSSRQPRWPWPDDDVSTVREEIARLQNSPQAAAIAAQAEIVWDLAVHRRELTVWCLRTYRPVTMLVFQTCAVGAISCARLLAGNHLTTDETERALFEPRRIMTPEGYHSTKCVAAGLFSLLDQARLTANTGRNLPTEITGSTFSYRVLEHNVPIYFVSEEFARAVAATELPADFTFADLHWPQMGMVIGWPPRFMQEYTSREACYVYAANCPEGQYWPTGRPAAPIIEVPEGRGKIGWFYYASTGGWVECFVSAYLTKDKVVQAFADYTYTDYMGVGTAKVQADKEFTERVSALMLKLLVILNMQPSLVTHGNAETHCCQSNVSAPFDAGSAAPFKPASWQ